jgi:hypothetical protein
MEEKARTNAEEWTKKQLAMTSIWNMSAVTKKKTFEITCSGNGGRGGGGMGS